MLRKISLSLTGSFSQEFVSQGILGFLSGFEPKFWRFENDQAEGGKHRPEIPALQKMADGNFTMKITRNAENGAALKLKLKTRTSSEGATEI